MSAIDVYNDPYSRRATAGKMRVEFEKLKRTKEFKRWRVRQLYKQEGKCAYCKISLRRENIVTHVDHVQPLYYDGKNIFDNLVLSCRRCNLRKWISDKYVVPDWIKAREAHLKRKAKLDPIRAKQKKLMKELVNQQLDEQAIYGDLSWLNQAK